MKKRLIGICGGLLCWMAAISPALATDLVHGGQVFASNCDACRLFGTLD